MTVYPALDDKIRINLFSGPNKRNSKSTSQIMCAHISSIIWNGFNTSEPEKYHRIQCSQCGKRFGNDLEMIKLLLYQEKIKKILYELFILKYPLTGITIRWGVP